jgi:p70 ribosomal S6 kinase
MSTTTGRGDDDDDDDDDGMEREAEAARAWALSGLTPPPPAGSASGSTSASPPSGVKKSTLVVGFGGGGSGASSRSSTPGLGESPVGGGGGGGTSASTLHRSGSGSVSLLSATLRRIDSGLLIDSEIKTLGESSDDAAAGSSSTRKLTPDDFDILKLVGQGAFGKVFQVRKKDSGGIYAMKVMKKDRIIAKDQAEYTKAERDILTAVTHPFVVSLRYSFQTTSKLYLILDFINGGHLFFQLYQMGTFGSELTKFYISEIVLAIGHLHGLSIMHRDLKPENILLDGDGHVKITDFGLAKKIVEDKRANSLAGSIDYMAPEILNAKGHGKTADWWSVGVLMFEMLSGTLPFKGKNKQAVQKAICSEKVKVPNYFLPDAVGLIKGLLAKDPSMRIGHGLSGTADVKGHKYFKGVDWAKIEAKAVSPPFKPNVNGRDCTANFDARWTDVDPVDSVAATPVSGEQEKFMGFTYVSSFMEEAMHKLGRTKLDADADDDRRKTPSDSDADDAAAQDTTQDDHEFSLSEEDDSDAAPKTASKPVPKRPTGLRPDAPSFTPGLRR